MSAQVCCDGVTYVMDSGNLRALMCQLYIKLSYNPVQKYWDNTLK